MTMTLLINSLSTSTARERGFTLIEVLVALFVLSIGLLGLAALQATGMKYNSDAYFRTQASIFAYDIIDRMRANPKGAGNGDYIVLDATAKNTKLSSFASCIADNTCKCDASPCTSFSKIATYDLGRWYDAQKATLPAAELPSTIQKAGNEHTITIRWRERGDMDMSQVWVVEL